MPERTTLDPQPRSPRQEQRPGRQWDKAPDLSLHARRLDKSGDLSYGTVGNRASGKKPVESVEFWRTMSAGGRRASAYSLYPVVKGRRPWWRLGAAVLKGLGGLEGL